MRNDETWRVFTDSSHTQGVGRGGKIYPVDDQFGVQFVDAAMECQFAYVHAGTGIGSGPDGDMRRGCADRYADVGKFGRQVDGEGSGVGGEERGGGWEEALLSLFVEGRDVEESVGVVVRFSWGRCSAGCVGGLTSGWRGVMSRGRWDGE